MVRSAETRQGRQPRLLGRLHQYRMGGRRSLGESEMRPIVVLVGDELSEQALQVPLVDNTSVGLDEDQDSLPPGHRLRSDTQKARSAVRILGRGLLVGRMASC